jgi:hypothetical protein
MLLFIFGRDTTSELWTPVQFLYIAISIYIYLLYYILANYYLFHSIRLILCSQQTDEIDNLIVS